MEPAAIILISSGISAVMTLLLLIFMDKKAKKIEFKARLAIDEYVHDSIKSAGQAVIETINSSLTEQLDPILKVNSQAMSIIGKAGAATNQLKMVERQVMEAVNQDLPISPDMIEEFSPALAETLRKYPELMPKALQVFNKVTGGGDLGGNVDWGFTSRANRRVHPLREE